LNLENQFCRFRFAVLAKWSENRTEPNFGSPNNARNMMLVFEILKSRMALDHPLSDGNDGTVFPRTLDRIFVHTIIYTG